MASKVEAIVKSEQRTSKAGKPYTLTTVLVDGREAQTMAKDVQVGDEGELTYNEQFKNWDFKKPLAAPASGSFRGAKEYKADPVKQDSIEKQSTLQRAVEITLAIKPDKAASKDVVKVVKEVYDELHDYVFKPVAPVTPVADVVPTAEDLDNLTLDNTNFFELLGKKDK